MAADVLIISACTLVNALGRGSQACFDALEQSRGGLRPCDFGDADIDTWIGRVDGLEEEPVVAGLGSFDCRNNRLAQLALGQDGFAERVAEIRRRYGSARVGVFVGTSTSGVLQAELAYRQRDPVSGALPTDFSYFCTQNAMSAAEFTRRFLSLEGPVMSVSTACSSSAKVFASAYRHIKAGLCDAAVVGGVDSLCFSTLYGFNSLGLVSDSPCRPWDADRSGMNIGEGAGFAVLEKNNGGAPGVTEILFALGSIERDFIPGTMNSERLDPALCADVLLQNRRGPVSCVLSNSFGFGGSNCSLLLGAVS